MSIENSPDKQTRFFKYCKSSPYSVGAIKSSTLWFSTSENLNDPFDLKYTLSDELLIRLPCAGYYFVRAGIPINEILVQTSYPSSVKCNRCKL